jgi:hypothetical protein
MVARRILRSPVAQLESFMEKPVHKLTDTQLDCVSGGGGGDIEALGFVVLMNASRSSQDDLATLMAETKAINNTKNMLRTQLSRR